MVQFTERPLDFRGQALWDGYNCAIIDDENSESRKGQKLRPGHLITYVNDIDVRGWHMKNIEHLLKSERVDEDPLILKIIRCNPIGDTV